MQETKKGQASVCKRQAVFLFGCISTLELSGDDTQESNVRFDHRFFPNCLKCPHSRPPTGRGLSLVRLDKARPAGSMFSSGQFAQSVEWQRQQ